MQRDYFTECGYRWEENEDGTLRLARQPVVADGAAVRTPMMFKDGKSHDQATRDAIAYECSAPGPACVFLDGAINPVTDDRDDPRIKAYRRMDAAARPNNKRQPRSASTATRPSHPRWPARGGARVELSLV
jgi:hypothetical protein